MSPAVVVVVIAAVLVGASALMVIVVGTHPRCQRAEKAAQAARRAVEAAEALQATASGRYLRRSTVLTWMDGHPNRIELLLSRRAARLLDPALRSRYDEAASVIQNSTGWADARNESFVAHQCAELASWFDSRLPNPLTEEQRQAVVTDEDANLVVAGAGSGKTVTLVAKVAYLIEHLGVGPGDILVLAFNKTVAQEVSQRISGMGLPVPEVSTFHAKGFEIMGRVLGRRPAVSSLATDSRELRQFLESELLARARSAAYLGQLRLWWAERRVEAWELRQQGTPDERLRKEQSLGLRTLNGTLVRSQAEVKVADWLTLNGIPWEHEAVYPHAQPSTERRDYTPDFYLPDHEVWVEVWACDASEQRFPPEIPAARYRDDMEWKRTTHAEHGTVLVEINQDDIWGSCLGEILAERLGDAGVTIRPLEDSEIDAVIESIRDSFDPLVGLVASFLSLFRAGGRERHDVIARAEDERDRGFLELFWPLLDAYEERLAAERKIDFDAMLIEAARALEGSGEPSDYRYILVDEYQDTSRARLEMIKQLRGDPAACQLFLVGDDWQSIYRFAGADVSYFTNAERHLGRTARTDLGRTFRLTPDVAQLSSHFITKNPNQLQKTIEPRTQDAETPGVSVRLHGRGGESKALVQVLDEIAADSTENSTVLMLGRYNFLLENLRGHERFDRDRMKALTVHRAKGLEADYVIVLGLTTGAFGFPTEIEDDRVLRMLLGDQQHFPNAEERRLFYVALTRTRSRVYLLADATETSPFVQEFLGQEYAQWIDLFGEASKRYRCPRCGGRTIRRRESQYGPFWGCIHYSACRGRLPVCTECRTGVLEPGGESRQPASYRCTECEHSTRACQECGTGALIKRDGRHGAFLGCSEWRRDGSGCDYTENVSR